MLPETSDGGSGGPWAGYALLVTIVAAGALVTAAALKRPEVNRAREAIAFLGSRLDAVALGTGALIAGVLMLVFLRTLV